MRSRYQEPTQDELEVRDIAFLNDWPDGTPKSFGTGFTEHMDGEESLFAGITAFRGACTTGKSISHTATQSRERVEATGKNIGTIVGLSKKVDATLLDAKRYHVTVSKGA